MKIEFSKIELEGNTPFIPLAVDSKQFKQQYLDYELSSHESYPSPWAAAVYFSKVLESFSGDVSVGSPQGRAAKMLDVYLKGIFLGILIPEKKDITHLPERLKENLKEQYPLIFSGQSNSVERGYLLMLRYRDFYVAIEYPDCMFFPATYFSYWPGEPEGLEKEMIEEIERNFAGLSGEVKEIFKNYISSLYTSYPSSSSPWARAFGGLSIDGTTYSSLPRFTGTLDRVCYYPEGVALNYQGKIKNKLNINGKEMPSNLVVYSPLGTLDTTTKVKVTFIGGSIKINVASDSCQEIFEIKEGCLGRDGNFYLIEDKFLPVYKGNLRIEICGVSPKVDEGTGPWDIGLRFKAGQLVVRDIANGTVLEDKKVRLVNCDDLFVERIIRIGGQTVDCALKKVFCRAESNGKIFGFVLNKRDDFTYEIPGVGSKNYSNNVLEINSLTLAIWPEFLSDYWKPYFIYFNPGGARVGLKFINEELGTGSSASVSQYIIETECQETVKKILRDFFREPSITFKDEYNKELGSFYLEYRMEPEPKNLVLDEVLFGVDFGTSSTVVSCSRRDAASGMDEARIIKTVFEPKMIFGKKYEINVHEFPIGEAEEIPSLLNIRTINGKVEDFSKGLEEASLVFYGTGFFETGYSPDRIKSQLKWKGSQEEIAAFLYIISLLAIKNELMERRPRRIKFIYSYPLSFSSDRFVMFAGAVRQVINLLKSEFPEFFSKNGEEEETFRFVSETDVISSLNYEQDTLIIDMGGGTSDLVYVSYIGIEKSYDFIDSLQIAGEKIIESLSKEAKIDNHKVGEIINTTQPLPLELQRSATELMEKFKRYIKFILKYTLRNLSAIPRAQGELDQTMSLNFKIVLFGNGWKMFDVFKHTGLKINSVIEEIFCGREIIYEQEPKSFLAKNLPSCWGEARLDATSGRKTTLGLGLDINGTQCPWNTPVPFETDTKKLKISRPRSSDSKEINCFELGERDINGRFAFTDDLVGIFSGKKGIIKSPLAKILEWKASKIMD